MEVVTPIDISLQIKEVPVSDFRVGMVQAISILEENEPKILDKKRKIIQNLPNDYLERVKAAADQIESKHQSTQREKIGRIHGEIFESLVIADKNICSPYNHEVSEELISVLAHPDMYPELERLNLGSSIYNPDYVNISSGGLITDIIEAKSSQRILNSTIKQIDGLVPSLERAVLAINLLGQNQLRQMGLEQLARKKPLQIRKEQQVILVVPSDTYKEQIFYYPDMNNQEKARAYKTIGGCELRSSVFSRKDIRYLTNYIGKLLDH